jgi:hypothetical protein
MRSRTWAAMACTWGSSTESEIDRTSPAHLNAHHLFVCAQLQVAVTIRFLPQANYLHPGFFVIGQLHRRVPFPGGASA